MKILSIEIENYKKIKVFSKNLNGENLIVSGKPDEGKTTAISALWSLLDANKEALRNGAKKGHIKLKIGDPGSEYFILAERKITPKTSSIIITDSEGRKVDKKTITDMLNTISSDPLKIMELKGNELSEYLLKTVKFPDGYDVEKIEADRKKLADDRLYFYRAMKDAEKQVGVEPPEVEEIDYSDIEQKIQNIESLLDKKESLENSNEINKKEIDVYAERKKYIFDQIESYKKTLFDLDEKISNLENKISDNEMYAVSIDAEIEDNGGNEYYELKQKQKNAIENEAKRSARNEWLKRKQNYDEKVKKHLEIEKQIQEIDKTKKKIMSEIKYPVDGLSIESGKVFYNGIPLENCGTEKQMLVSASIVAAQDFGIKAMRIDRAESMGKSGREKLIEICKNLGVQICMSRVTDGQKETGEIQLVEGIYSE